jgi:phasin family protein
MVKPQTPFDFDVSKMLNPGRMFADLKFTGVDMDAMIAGQRRNLEAFTAANQAALEGLQAVTRRQAEMLRQSVDEATQAMKDMLAAGSPEEKAARQTDLAKSAFARAVANTRELTDIVARSQGEALDVLNKRVTEGLEEVKSMIAKRAKESRAAA